VSHYTSELLSLITFEFQPPRQRFTMCCIRMQIIFEDAQRGHVMKEGKLPEDLLDDIAKVTCTTARGASGQKYGILW
jgi:hypothetical protein